MIKMRTSEFVSPGHPDKVCDQLSDRVVLEALKQDKNSRVACETMITENNIIFAGQVTTKAQINYGEIAREVLEEIGYTDPEFGFLPETYTITNLITEQSADIALGVDKEDQGAGDQGIMFGYATDETDTLMPIEYELARSLCEYIYKVFKREYKTKGRDCILGPDGKTQITVCETEDPDHNKKYIVKNIVASWGHRNKYSTEEVREYLNNLIMSWLLDESNTLVKGTDTLVIPSEDIEILINQTGRFVIQGPKGDTGLTGRKIVVDAYGGAARVGGGAYSGKDPSKVDRSAAYAARQVAVSLVTSGLCSRVEVGLSYCIGVSEPTSISITTFGTSVKSDEEILEIIRKNFNLKTKEIIDSLELVANCEDLYKTSSFGHYGAQKNFSWEKPKKLN